MISSVVSTLPWLSIDHMVAPPAGVGTRTKSISRIGSPSRFAAIMRDCRLSAARLA